MKNRKSRAATILLITILCFSILIETNIIKIPTAKGSVVVLTGLNRPEDIFVDGSGNIYVVDTLNSKIAKFDSNGGLIDSQWNVQNLNMPMGICGFGGYIYIADSGNDRVLKLDVVDGSTVHQWSGSLSNPIDVATDSSGYLFVTDNGNQRISVFDVNGAGGGPINNWGGFSDPRGIACDGLGNVYVVDRGAGNSVQEYDHNGVPIASWGSGGVGEGNFNAPWGIAADGVNVYVADSFNHRIQRFYNNPPSSIGIFNWAFNFQSQLGVVNGVAIDNAQNLYIADTFNNRVLKLSQYTLDINKVDPSGLNYNYVLPFEGSRLYPEGSTVALRAVATHGYIFSYWSGDVTGIDNPTTLTMTGNKVVTANFLLPSATVYVIGNPASFGQSVRFFGNFYPLSTNLVARVTNPDGSWVITPAFSSSIVGTIDKTFFPDGGVGPYSVQIIDYSGNKINAVLATNTFEVTQSSLIITPNPAAPTHPIVISGQIQSTGVSTLDIVVDIPDGRSFTFASATTTDSNGNYIYNGLPTDNPFDEIGYYTVKIADHNDPTKILVSAILTEMQPSATVSVSPDPAQINQEVTISGEVTPPINYALRVEIHRPDSTILHYSPLYTNSAGQYEYTDTSIGVATVSGIYTVDIFDDSSNTFLGSTSFTVLPQGLTITNNVQIPTANPPIVLSEDWTYSITDPSGHATTFTLPTTGGTTTIPLSQTGTYQLTQTKKLNFDTAASMDGVDVPLTTINNQVSLNVVNSGSDAISIVFDNSWLTDAEFARPGPTGGSGSSSPNYNIPCRVALPVQGPWNPDIQPDQRIDLVKGKPIKVVVNLADLLNTKPGGILSPTGTDAANTVLISVTSPDGFFTPVFQDQTRTGSQINTDSAIVYSMNPPSTTGPFTIQCIIKQGTNTISSTTTLVYVKETAPLSLYYTHLYRPEYGTESPTAYDAMVTNTRDFIQGVYPVSSVNVLSNPNGIAGEPQQVSADEAYLGILKDCQKMEAEAAANFPLGSNAIGVGIGADLAIGGSYKNYFAYHGAVVGKSTAVGASWGPSVRGVVVSDGYYSAAAHEIGHVYGLYFGIPEQYKTYDPGAPATGYWPAQNQWRTGYDFMGLSVYKSTTSTWVSTSLAFEPLFRVLKTSADPQIIRVSGIIYKDPVTGAITADMSDSWFTIPSGTPDNVPAGSHFALKFTVNGGGTVEVPFDAQFYMNLDPGIALGDDLPANFDGFGNIATNFAGFAFKAPYPPGTTRVDLVDKTNGDKVIATKQARDIANTFGGFMQPINSDGSSIFKSGSTVPVKFQLRAPSGTYITDAIAKISYTKITDNVLGTFSEAVSTSAATTGNLFRYDSSSNQYIFNLSTKGLTKGTYMLQVSFEGGTSQYITISLK